MTKPRDLVMSKPKYYAGIGSRSAPDNILHAMQCLAQQLEREGYTLRSGGAKGSDRAFESGVSLGFKEIFRPKDAEANQRWAFIEAVKHLPTDRSGFDSWSYFVQGLIARSMQQILGLNGDAPVEFVLCWAPSLNYTDSSAGGTGYAIRCAQAHGIPVWNMFDPAVLRKVSEALLSDPPIAANFK